MIEIEANLQSVKERISAAADRSGRPVDAIILVAISKTQPPEAIEAAWRLGVEHFGENRVEEASGKIPVVRQLIAQSSRGRDPVWHMVGHVQSRKASEVMGTFEVLHSLDSVKLARRLSRMGGEDARPLRVLLELNVSGEESKYGFMAHRYWSDTEQREQLCRAVREILDLPSLEVCGLMTMAPVVSEPEEARPFFIRLRDVRDDLRERFPQCEWQGLSMGMTDDFEVAVEEGATLLRIGRAVFGPRR